MTGSVVTIQSESMRVIVIPELGAQITSLMDSDGHEYLSPGLWPRPDNLPLSASFNDGGLGGSDDCIPAVAADIYPNEPYKGQLIPDHGELWQRPWRVIKSSSKELIVSIDGVFLPYSLVRRMIVNGPILDIEYQLINNGEYDLPIVWASHPMLVSTSEMTIDFAHSGYLKVEACNMGFEQDARIPYPIVKILEQDVDLRSWKSLPEGFFLKAFSPLPAGSPVRLNYPEWGKTLEITTTADQPVQLGIWLNRSGFRLDHPVEHLSIEPTFGSADALTRAMVDNSNLTLRTKSDELWHLSYRVLDLLNRE